MGLEAGEDEPVYLEFAGALELYAAIIGGTVAQPADQLRHLAGLERHSGDRRATPAATVSPHRRVITKVERTGFVP